MANKFTDAPKRPPLQGARFGIPSPILESYAASKETTMGQVVSFTATAADQLDRCEVYFMGKIIRATCCHPGITDGMNVNMIEQPRGVWWATVMQKSWYSRPLLQLIQKGHGYQAAVEYLLSFGAKWKPRLIIIDKRGTSAEPIVPYVPLNVSGDMIIGYDLASWPYDQGLFDGADKNGDGFVDADELADWLNGAGSGVTAALPETGKIGHTAVLHPDNFGGFGLGAYVEFTFPVFGPAWSTGTASGRALLSDVVRVNYNNGTVIGLRFLTYNSALKIMTCRFYFYTIRQAGWPGYQMTAIWDQHVTQPDLEDTFIRSQ